MIVLRVIGMTIVGLVVVVLAAVALELLPMAFLWLDRRIVLPRKVARMFLMCRDLFVGFIFGVAVLAVSAITGYYVVSFLAGVKP